MARTNMEGISHNMQTKFPVHNGRGWAFESIINPAQPSFSPDGWEYYCKKMDEKAATRASRAAKFIEDGIKAGVYTIQDNGIVVADDRLKNAFFCAYAGDVGHCGDLYYEAMLYFDRDKLVITRKRDRAPADRKEQFEAKAALEKWLTDNYRRFVSKTVK